MDELQIRLRVMQSTFAEDKAQMSIELAEIARVLELKTELVTKLTGLGYYKSFNIQKFRTIG